MLPDLCGREEGLSASSWMDCLGGKRRITEARGDGIVNHFTDENQDGNLWKKTNNGTLKWTVRRRRQELESFTWMAEGPCSSQRAREVGHIGFSSQAQTESGKGGTAELKCLLLAVFHLTWWCLADIRQPSSSQRELLLVFLVKHFHF